ncbi:MAG: histidine triad (HIT) family protein [Halobacteriales archaeon]|jgi:histidine triad (HIT) family protein
MGFPGALPSIMSPDCTFCRIVEGDLPSRTVYEDPEVEAFLDANPLAPGHTLIVPKAHYERLNDLPEEPALSLLGTMYRLLDPVERAVEADATTIAFNNGRAAGQEIPHVHGHLIPRFKGDGGGPVHGIVPSRPNLSAAELDEIAGRIAESLD